MKIRFGVFLLLPLLAASVLLWPGQLAAKPKIEVRVRLNDGFGVKPPNDSLSKTGSSYEGALPSGMIYYLNVTVRSDNAEAVAKNSGQWCLKGEMLLESFEYHATMDGNSIEIEVPQKNGKTKKVTFKIFDRKWHKESDI